MHGSDENHRTGPRRTDFAALSALLILVSFYSAMTIELVLAELLCCDCERVFCNSLYFMFLHFILYCGQL